MAGTVAYGTFTGKQKHRQHDRDVTALFERFRQCPDKSTLPQNCIERTRREAISRAAEVYRSTKRFEQAGLAYAELGETAKAMEMAGECVKSGDEKGRRNIDEKLGVFADALRRYAMRPEPAEK